MKEAAGFSEYKALEKAAKYICNYHEGLCPMVVEKMQCRLQCTMETVPWHCWIAFFNERLAAEQQEYEDAD